MKNKINLLSKIQKLVIWFCRELVYILIFQVLFCACKSGVLLCKDGYLGQSLASHFIY